MTGEASENPPQVVLKATGLYKLYSRKPAALSAHIARMFKAAVLRRPPPQISGLKAQEFWALNDINFELKHGEALGIIGLNGSGKTTLLRILAGQIPPDRGEVWMRGATAAMIDLNAGFQPGASGRENIYLRSAALGFTRREANDRLDEIINFSELGDAIEAPMATYSAGMKMRLAFSVMAIVRPDILFIDEVLAVGDFRFRQKCLAKIAEIRSNCSFVFVSHSMADVARFCDRVIVLRKGNVVFIGPPKEAIEIYENMGSTEEATQAVTKLETSMGETFSNEEAVHGVEHFWCDAGGAPVSKIPFSQSPRLMLRFHASADIRRLIIGVPVWNINGQYTTGMSTQITSDEFVVKAGDEVRLMLEIAPGQINPGQIKSMLGIVDGVRYLYRQPNPELSISGAPHPTYGAVTVPHTWKRLDAEVLS